MVATLLAVLGLLAGIAFMQWGAQRVCAFLSLLRRRRGLSQMAGGALVGLATATPEMSVNIAAVAFGWPGIGLGTALGSNIPALPLIFIVGYAALLRRRRQSLLPLAEAPAAPVHDETHPVQTLPYLAIVLLLAALTLPPWWAGLQPIDGLLLAGAYVLYLAQALLRHRETPQPVAIGLHRLMSLAVAVLALAMGSVVAVLATNHLNGWLGLPDVVGGLFLTGFLCALPETISAARLTREGQATTAVSAAAADGTASISLAFVPLTLVSAPIGDLPLYLLNLGYLLVVLLLYLLLSHRSTRGADISLTKVACIGGCYGGYLVGILALHLIPS